MTEKLISKLESGKEFTTSQLERATGLMNVRSTIHRLREEGFEIYTNRHGGNSYYRWNVAA